MRKWPCLLLLLLLPLAGCRREEPARTAYQLYFLEADLTYSAGESPFRTETVYLYDAETGAAPRLAEALLNELLKGPADETLKSALPAGTTLLTLELNGDRALVDLSPSYESLSGVALTLADSAIALTLSQVPEVSSVQITVRGRELAYREQPVLNIRDILLTPEGDVISTVDVLLYYLNQEGRLTAAEQTLDLYEGDTQVSAVARALERQPEGRDLLSPLPENFQVKSVWLEEDICYVNLSSALLEGLEDGVLQTALQALEDSLSSLEAVEEVRFLVDGEFRRDLQVPGGGAEQGGGE
nr:GerMN domain-containing protein [uncultured Oscillibacter sp.]